MPTISTLPPTVATLPTGPMPIASNLTASVETADAIGFCDVIVQVGEGLPGHSPQLPPPSRPPGIGTPLPAVRPETAAPASPEIDVAQVMIGSAGRFSVASPPQLAPVERGGGARSSLPMAVPHGDVDVDAPAPTAIRPPLPAPVPVAQGFRNSTPPASPPAPILGSVRARSPDAEPVSDPIATLPPDVLPRPMRPWALRGVSALTIAHAAPKPPSDLLPSEADEATDQRPMLDLPKALTAETRSLPDSVAPPSSPVLGDVASPNDVPIAVTPEPRPAPIPVFAPVAWTLPAPTGAEQTAPAPIILFPTKNQPVGQQTESASASENLTASTAGPDRSAPDPLMAQPPPALMPKVDVDMPNSAPSFASPRVPRAPNPSSTDVQAVQAPAVQPGPWVPEPQAATAVVTKPADAFAAPPGIALPPELARQLAQLLPMPGRETADAPSALPEPPPLSAPAPIAQAVPAPAQPPAIFQIPAVDTGRGEWMQAMIERIAELPQVDGRREAMIRLLPDALGAVEVTIVERDDRLHVTLNADSAQARQLLSEAAPRLHELAEARGLRFAQTEFGGGQPQDRRPASEQPPQAPLRPRSATATDDDPHPEGELIA